MPKKESLFSVPTGQSVVIERRFADLEDALRGQNMLVIVAPTDEIDAAARNWLLSGRILIVEDEAPYIGDASSHRYGIVALRQLVNRDPDHVAKRIRAALLPATLWSLGRAYLLLLHNDGGHTYTPLGD